MVEQFTFTRVPKIIFRSGAVNDLPGIIRKYGKNIILVTGRESFLSSPGGISLLEEFAHHGIEYQAVSIPAEPTPEMIDQAKNRLASEKADLVLAIGGGSVLDGGKAISAMMHKQESVIEFLEGVGTKEHPGTRLPLIAVPTTSGTGSEATKNAVISRSGKDGFKKSLRHDNFVPDIALIDPTLTLQCPKDITAASGMDCFTQLMEAFLSVKSGEYTDALAIAGLKQVKLSLVGSYLHGDNSEARTGMSFAALTSGICLANAGLGVVHGFASSIGGMIDIPHGVICGTLMGKANEINVRELRKNHDNAVALGKYVTLGKLFLNKDDRTDNYYIDGFIDFLNRMTQELKLPGLKKYGLQNKDFELVCLNTDNKNNPVELDQENLLEILTSRFF